MTTSRKYFPFTPFDRELSEGTSAIVPAVGVHLKEQEPFNITDELGDLGYRIISPEHVFAIPACRSRPATKQRRMEL
ncbi:MAG: hypothetical protein QOE77_475 [Blastocatellia bacterium]|jgi:hypothetical protein|nr:hypothetical protein [Blastocatellia bacterium]